MALMKGEPWNNILSLLWLWFSSATSRLRWEYFSHNFMFLIFWILEMLYRVNIPPKLYENIIRVSDDILSNHVNIHMLKINDNFILPACPWSLCSRTVDCISSSTALNSGSSLVISIKTVDWLLVLGGGCQITGALKYEIAFYCQKYSAYLLYKKG